jgi:hypothetical protein
MVCLLSMCARVAASFGILWPALGKPLLHADLLHSSGCCGLAARTMELCHAHARCSSCWHAAHKNAQPSRQPPHSIPRLPVLAHCWVARFPIPASRVPPAPGCGRGFPDTAVWLVAGLLVDEGGVRPGVATLRKLQHRVRVGVYSALPASAVEDAISSIDAAIRQQLGDGERGMKRRLVSCAGHHCSTYSP